MWPIRPRLEALTVSLSSTRSAPLAPPTQVRPRRSCLSSKSCWMLTWDMSLPLPFGEQLVDCDRVVGVLQLVAEGFFAEHLRQLSQQLQVQISRALGDEQHEDEGDRQAIGRIERNRIAQLDERGDRVAQPLHAAMRDRHALAQAGGAELLACEQAVEHLAAGDVLRVLE